MNTSQQWWDEVKADTAKLNEWLQRQCFGEKQAHIRISSLAVRFGNETLLNIATDELKHHNWLMNYLIHHNIPRLSTHEERYWKPVQTSFETLEEVGAVGHLAEMMRLDRIRIIAKDDSVPELQKIFKRILKDEEFHASFFKSLTNEEQIEMSKVDHEQGMLAMGLTA